MEEADNIASIPQLIDMVFNVQDFGAKGNVRDDDTAAIQAAEAAAASGRGAALFFPPGTYRFTHTITATTILGHNRQKTILHHAGEGDAVGNGGGTKYHRKFESFTLRGEGAGVGLNLDSSPAGSYRNMIVQDFETGIWLDGIDGADSLYNVFDDVTMQNNTTGVTIRGICHENRFNNFRINYATTGFDIQESGRNVIIGSSIENCATGVVIRDQGPGRNVANTIIATRFEFNTVNIDIEPNVAATSLIVNHYVGGALSDRGVGTRHLDTRDYGRDSFGGAADTAEAADLRAPAAKVDTIYGQSGLFTRSRIQMHETGTVVDRNREGPGTALRVNHINAASTGNIADFQKASATAVRIANSGHLGIQASSAPDAAGIATGEAQLWVDTTDGAARLVVTGKQSDGNVVTGSIPLA